MMAVIPGEVSTDSLLVTALFTAGAYVLGWMRKNPAAAKEALQTAAHFASKFDDEREKRINDKFAAIDADIVGLRKQVSTLMIHTPSPTQTQVVVEAPKTEAARP